MPTRLAQITVTLVVGLVCLRLTDDCQGQAAGHVLEDKDDMHKNALKYPSTQRGDQTDDYHGTKVADPYRWLEDPNSKQTREWIDAQNKVTNAYLESIPERDNVRRRLTELWNYERFGIPRTEAGKYFYSRNSGLQNQSVLYVADSLAAEPRVLLNPNLLSEDGTVALAGTQPSDDGSLLAYGLAAGGSDWNEWKVRRVKNAEDLGDHLKWIKFSSASWKNDTSGFFYSRYDEPPPDQTLTSTNYYQKVFFHKLGTPQSDDSLVYERRDHKDWTFYHDVTDDGRYLVITVAQGTRRENQIFYLDLSDPNAKVVELLTGFDADYTFVGNDGPTFWFVTDLDAPRRRLIAVDINHPERANWREIIPQAADILRSVSQVGQVFIAVYLKDAASRVKVFDLDGKYSHDIDLPGLGSAGGFGGKRGDRETFYAFSTFTAPTTIYRYDLTTMKSEVFRRPKIDFDSDRYETRQLFATSRDGTRVPVFVTCRKDVTLDGNNPTLLYAYGGFNISLTPSFDVRTAVWLEMGGVYAQANLRGGGEYGVEWHEGGRLHNKQNVFDDFFAAAELLVREKYTRPEKLAIAGRSNGGLLVGAAMTQRPELFAAALPGVGVMDMLRFHKFTIGWAWVPEYGSADNPADFRTLFKYSPLHNLASGKKYPATLIVTADHDDRVVPAHSFKFAAALQAAQSAGSAPALIRIETKAGHGAGMALSKEIDETTDELSFLVKALGVKQY
jgi:prolyl oligopeptidase